MAEDTETIKDLEKRVLELEKAAKRLQIPDGLDATLATFTSDATPSESAVAHNLKRVPTGFIVVSASAQVNVWKDPGGTPWSATKIYPLCDTAGVSVTLLLF